MPDAGGAPMARALRDGVIACFSSDAELSFEICGHLVDDATDIEIQRSRNEA
jgi:hypothetical protein